MKKQKSLTIYIGWDSRESIAAEVCKHSILEHASIPVNIVYLKQEELRKQGIYWRDVDALASTEFTFSRFLVPYLNNYNEFAVFVDCDFVFLHDVAELLELADSQKAIQVVQHNYTPPEGVKMDGKAQLPYPRKNWSSMILWNCAHKDNRIVDLDFVNTATGQELHRFSWLKDHKIGNISPEWNWLVGWYREVRDGYPKALHYTLGGPWFDTCQDSEYADVWKRYRQSLEYNKPDKQITLPKHITLPPTLSRMIEDLLLGEIDPNQLVYPHQASTALDYFNCIKIPKCMGLLDCDPDQEEEYLKEDPILDNFLIGAEGQVGSGKRIRNLPVEVPAVIRGIVKKKLIHECIETGRDYYYIDSGYFGNDKRKHYHRVTKNNMQYTGEIDPDCPRDRFVLTGVGLKKFRGGRNILICPPSEKAMSYWGLDLQQWLNETVKIIATNTDRPIVIRKKQPRHVRTNVDTIEMALNQDVHCLVTFNSIAAVEALMHGKPVFTMGPNAAQPLSNTDLSQIDSPRIPTMDEVYNLCCNLAYQQFTLREMRDGTAWRMLNGL